MALTNPIDTFLGGFNKWYVWLIFIIALALWLWRIDRDMKSNGGEGIFSNLFEGLWD